MTTSIGTVVHLCKVLSFFCNTCVVLPTTSTHDFAARMPAYVLTRALIKTK